MKVKLKSKPTSFLLILFVLSFCSCQYEPSDNYTREVNNQVPVPTLSVDGLVPSGSTVYIANDTVLTFHFTCSNNIFQLVFAVDDNSIRLTFDNEHRSGDGYRSGPTRGFHKYSVDIYSQLGTGSIADELNAESYCFSLSRDVFVDGTVESTCYATFDNKKAILEWVVTKYNK
jgi:hypothetical protein